MPGGETKIETVNGRTEIIRADLESAHDTIFELIRKLGSISSGLQVLLDTEEITAEDARDIWQKTSYLKEISFSVENDIDTVQQILQMSHPEVNPENQDEIVIAPLGTTPLVLLRGEGHAN